MLFQINPIELLNLIKLTTPGHSNRDCCCSVFIITSDHFKKALFFHNHLFQSVWGSFWKSGKWGYACCHSFIKHSYCTGEAGKEIQAGELTLPPIASTNKGTKPRISRLKAIQLRGLLFPVIFITFVALH